MDTVMEEDPPLFVVDEAEPNDCVDNSQTNLQKPKVDAGPISTTEPSKLIRGRKSSLMYPGPIASMGNVEEDEQAQEESDKESDGEVDYQCNDSDDKGDEAAEVGIDTDEPHKDTKEDAEDIAAARDVVGAWASLSRKDDADDDDMPLDLDPKELGLDVPDGVQTDEKEDGLPTNKDGTDKQSNDGVPAPEVAMDEQKGKSSKTDQQEEEHVDSTVVVHAIIRNKLAKAMAKIMAVKTIRELHGGNDGKKDIPDTKRDVPDESKEADQEADDGAEDYMHMNRYPNIHLACMYGRTEIAKMILETERNMADSDVSELVNTLDPEKKTPLYWALSCNHFDIAKLCVKKGADVRRVREDDKELRSCLHLIAKSGDEDIVSFLHEHGAEINAENARKETPLYTFAAKANLSACNELIERGADLEKRCHDGYTALLVATNAGHVKMVELLLESGANIFAVTKQRKTAVHLAVLNDNVEILEVLMKHVRKRQRRKLMNMRDYKGRTPLHCVAYNGNLDALLCLRKHVVDLTVRDDGDRTVLHVACKSGRTSIVNEILDTNKVLHKIKDSAGNSVLHLAAEAGQDEVIRMLLSKRKADVDARNDSGKQPLHLAAEADMPKTCELLLEQGAEVDPVDFQKEAAPLYYACARGASRVIPILIDHGADVTRRDWRGDSCLDIAIERNQGESAFALVRSKWWKEALVNANWDINEKRWDTPMRKLIRTMPEVAREVLDKCTKKSLKQEQTVYTNKADNPDEKVAEVETGVLMTDQKDRVRVDLMENEEEFTFDYGLIDDTDWKDEKMRETCELAKNHKFISSPGPRDVSKYREKENHCLRVMIQYTRVDLISHPLVRSLLRQKWNKFGLSFFIFNLSMYVIFLVALTCYILSVEFLAPIRYKGHPIVENFTGNDCEKIRQYRALIGPVATLPLQAFISKYVVLALSGIQLFKELVQMLSSPRSYFNVENLFEWLIYVTAILVVIDFGTCYAETGIRKDWQWQLAALCIFWSWINLLLYIRKLPLFGIYVTMFTAMLRSFFFFLPVFLLFVIAFAMSFYCLLVNQVPFRTEFFSAFKSFTMATGGLSYPAIFDDRVGDDDPQVQVWYEVVTYIQATLFIIIMSILVMNLLVGLAVGDIKAVMEQSEIDTLAMLADFCLDVEPMVRRICPQKFGKKGCCRSTHSDDNASTCVCCRGVSRKEDRVIQDGRHRVVLDSYRDGLMAWMGQKWVLSQTAIIKQSSKNDTVEDQTPKELRKLPEQVQQLRAENKELRESVKEMVERNQEISKEIMKISKTLGSSSSRRPSDPPPLRRRFSVDPLAARKASVEALVE